MQWERGTATQQPITTLLIFWCGQPDPFSFFWSTRLEVISKFPSHSSLSTCMLCVYIRDKLLGQTVVLRPRQKTVLSLGHVNAKIKFTFTIGAGIPARPSRQYFAREPPCSRVFYTLTAVVTHYYGRDIPAHSSDTAAA